MDEIWTFSLRAASRDDARPIAETFVAAAREAWPPIVGADALARLEAPIARFEERLPSDDVLVAEDAEGIVGFVEVEADDGEVAMLYTLPRVWGRGVGRALLDAALGILREAGCAEARLWTEERNERPRRVYEAGGWVADGGVRRRRWQGVALTELRYRLPLGHVDHR